MNDLVFLDSMKSMPLMSLPVRSTVVPTANGVVLLSPGSNLSDADLRRAGAVTDIVAPSLFHTAGVARAMRIFPKARVWGPLGARAAKPEIPWTDELTESSWPHQEDLKLIPLKGLPKVAENLFLHRASKSLIVTDLFFNVREARGFGAWLIMGAFGTYRRFGVSRFFMRFVEDREAFAASLKRMLDEKFERIVVGHGDIANDGPEAARRALRERGVGI